MNKIFELSLPKWPMMVVKGKSVTTDQAAEIIVRCSGTYFCSNDKEWDEIVNSEFGITDSDVMPYYKQYEFLAKKFRLLHCEYLLLDSKISNSFVSGPIGWCDWDGVIKTKGYNIGKWPSVDVVYREWRRIAKAFKFLNLRCQLFDKSSCEENPKPVVEFMVDNGRVKCIIPTEAMQYEYIDFSDLTNYKKHSRGCTIEQLRNGIKLAKKEKNEENKQE